MVLIFLQKKKKKKFSLNWTRDCTYICLISSKSLDFHQLLKFFFSNILYYYNSHNMSNYIPNFKIHK